MKDSPPTFAGLLCRSMGLLTRRIMPFLSDLFVPALLAPPVQAQEQEGVNSTRAAHITCLL